MPCTRLTLSAGMITTFKNFEIMPQPKGNTGHTAGQHAIIWYL